jgi:hypothetical protein
MLFSWYVATFDSYNKTYGLYGAFFVKGASRHFCRALLTPFFCSTRAAEGLSLTDASTAAGCP